MPGNDNVDININELLSDIAVEIPSAVERRCKACNSIIKSKSYNGVCAYCIAKQ